MKKIMVVDDEKLIADMLERFFRMNGFEVVKAVGGEEAIKALSAVAGLDVIVMDMRMPVVSGEDVMRKMQELKIDIPVILLTGAIDVDDTSHNTKEKNITADDILHKPLDLSDLLKKVKEKLGEN